MTLGCSAALGGCAINQLTPSSATCLPSSLDVIASPPDMQDVSLRRVFHDGDKTVTTETLQADRQHINERLQPVVTQVLSSIHRSPEFITDVPVSEPSLTAMDSSISTENLLSMQNAHPAAAYLRLRITDFGETPRRWKTSYITFEVVTTLAIAGALYVHRVTRAVAGVYLLQESIEELSEGYAGFWALNRLSQPVRIEADLLDGKTGHLLLHIKHTGMATWQWRNVWHMDGAKREQLQNQSLQRAVSSVLNDVNNFYLKRCGIPAMSKYPA